MLLPMVSVVELRLRSLAPEGPGSSLSASPDPSPHDRSTNTSQRLLDAFPDFSDGDLRGLWGSSAPPKRDRFGG